MTTLERIIRIVRRNQKKLNTSKRDVQEWGLFLQLLKEHEQRIEKLEEKNAEEEK